MNRSIQLAGHTIKPKPCIRNLRNVPAVHLRDVRQFRPFLVANALPDGFPFYRAGGVIRLSRSPTFENTASFWDDPPVFGPFAPVRSCDLRWRRHSKPPRARRSVRAISRLRPAGANRHAGCKEGAAGGCTSKLLRPKSPSSPGEMCISFSLAGAPATNGRRRFRPRSSTPAKSKGSTPF